MLPHFARLLAVAGLLTLCWIGQPSGSSQPPGPTLEPPILDVAAVPQGVEVQARGPVHEAFATPTSEPKPTTVVGKKPPVNIEEMPPEEKPDGDVDWIGGYWAWDDDRQDYLWVSGCWRVKPEGQDWVPGYWRETAGQWQWVPGFWTTVAAGRPQEVTYYPEPPPPPAVAPPGDPPNVDMVYVPGNWHWVGTRYVWRTGHWTRARTGFVYVPAHYRWTPFGHVHVAGYWDWAVPRRGVLYAPVVVNTVVVGPRFVFTPYYAVSDVVVLDALFIHPGRCHYYFGDYYGPRYRTMGYETCVVYSRRHYDPIIVHSRWEHRANPRWLDVQITLAFARDSGRAPVPPRTLVQQNTVVHNTTINNVTVNKTVINNVQVNNVSNTTVLAPTKNVLAARGSKSVKIDPAARAEAKTSADNVQQAVVKQRLQTEMTTGFVAKDNVKPKVTTLNVPATPGRFAKKGGPGEATHGQDVLGTKPSSLGSTLKPPGTTITTPGTTIGGPGKTIDPSKPSFKKGPLDPPTIGKKVEPPKTNVPQVGPAPTGAAPKDTPKLLDTPKFFPPKGEGPKKGPPRYDPPKSEPSKTKIGPTVSPQPAPTVGPQPKIDPPAVGPAKPPVKGGKKR